MKQASRARNQYLATFFSEFVKLIIAICSKVSILYSKPIGHQLWSKCRLDVPVDSYFGITGVTIT